LNGEYAAYVVDVPRAPSQHLGDQQVFKCDDRYGYSAEIHGRSAIQETRLKPRSCQNASATSLATAEGNERRQKRNVLPILIPVCYRYQNELWSGRMAKLDSEAKAVRLAQAIASDIALYNESKLELADQTLATLSEEIDEGRELFKQRVTAEYHHLFDPVVRKLLLKTLPPDAVPPPEPVLEFGGYRTRPKGSQNATGSTRQEYVGTDPITPQRSKGAMVLAVLIVLIGLGAGLALLNFF
jgi:hypothetical protein